MYCAGHYMLAGCVASALTNTVMTTKCVVCPDVVIVCDGSHFYVAAAVLPVP
jgi:hypothetical protein